MGQERYAKIEEMVEGVAKALGRETFTIIEVGVWNGGRAMRMAEAAFRGGALKVHYCGYDLFEQATPDINLRELNAKPNQTFEKVNARLSFFKAKNPGFSFDLFKGNTNETLKDKSLMADFVYIDGGHSVETIANDYRPFKNCPLVVFDDYYLGLDEETLDRVGANRTVDALPHHDLIDTGDELKMGDVRGTVALAVVRRQEWPDPADEPEPDPVGAGSSEPSPAAPESLGGAFEDDDRDMTDAPEPVPVMEDDDDNPITPKPKRTPRKRASRRKSREFPSD